MIKKCIVCGDEFEVGTGLQINPCDSEQVCSSNCLDHLYNGDDLDKDVPPIIREPQGIYERDLALMRECEDDA